MNAQELRIGNWVYNSYKEVTQVSTLSKWKDIHDSSFFEPIPLTEIRLREFGFFVDGNKAHIVYNESGNIYNLNRIGDTFHSSYLATEIPYVHILQNHFFFNIGKELIHKIH